MPSLRPPCAAIRRRRQAWATDQVTKAATAARRAGTVRDGQLHRIAGLPLSLPLAQRPPGLVETAFTELARRWRPILDAYDDAGVDIGFELHPGEDVFDGASWERFLLRRGRTPARAHQL